MSAANNTDVKDVLSGSFMQIAVVDDTGTQSETEAVIGRTMGETTITQESTTTEFQLHETQWTQTFNEHKNLSTEFVVAVHADMDAFETMNLVDSNGEVLPNVEKDIRVYIYDQEPAQATSPEQVFELYRVELNWSEITLPQDGSEVTIQGDINGGWQNGKTVA